MNDVASNSFRNSHLCFVFCAYYVKEGINNISPPPRFFFFSFLACLQVWLMMKEVLLLITLTLPENLKDK